MTAAEEKVVGWYIFWKSIYRFLIPREPVLPHQEAPSTGPACFRCNDRLSPE